MLNFRRSEYSTKRRNQAGPVIVAILFLLLACGISIDFFAGRFFNDATEGARAVVGSAVDTAVDSGFAVGNFLGGLAGPETTRADRTKLPFAEPLPAYADPVSRARAPSSMPEQEPELAIVRDRKPSQQEISLEVKEEEYKLLLSPSKWNGKPQLLPIPMLVSQMEEKRATDIRGAGWVAIDIARAEIIPVELFRGKQKPGGGKPFIEARRLDGREIVSSSNTGFPIVRGVKDLRVGNFQVFENPPCSVRFGGVAENEICDISLRNSKIRYKFEPPALGEYDMRSGLELSNVYVDVGRGNWKQIGSFNENFYPIGDANRDGFPDFYAESVTSDDNSGLQTLLISHPHDDTVDYEAYSAHFRSAR